MLQCTIQYNTVRNDTLEYNAIEGLPVYLLTTSCPWRGGITDWDVVYYTLNDITQEKRGKPLTQYATTQALHRKKVMPNRTIYLHVVYHGLNPHFARFLQWEPARGQMITIKQDTERLRSRHQQGTQPLNEPQHSTPTANISRCLAPNGHSKQGSKREPLRRHPALTDGWQGTRVAIDPRQQHPVHGKYPGQPIVQRNKPFDPDQLDSCHSLNYALRGRAAERAIC